MSVLSMVKRTTRRFIGCLLTSRTLILILTSRHVVPMDSMAATPPLAAVMEATVAVRWNGEAMPVEQAGERGVRLMQHCSHVHVQRPHSGG